MADAPSFSLAGKVVVQCGGSGLLGRALVSSLAASGAQLVVATRNPAKLIKVPAPPPIAGHRVSSEYVDVTEASSIVDLRDRVFASHGRLDGLVYSAVSRPMRRIA
jgi:NAD(P)-dependent dehydrogenase (short-subunit alcohol dehydrogenase family)